MTAKKIEEVMATLAALRALDADMPIAQALSLLVIAQKDGLSLKELAKEVGVGMASASRYVAAFGKPSATGRKGLGLVTATEDPFERRKKIISLTAKGKVIVNKITGANV
jgi:DNA-binding MarR family transcriptional regulator